MHCKNILLIFFILFLSSFLLSSEFNTINTNKAYLRAGPGQWYPIKWVLRIPGLPIKVLDENADYKMIEIYDGTKGWVASRLTSNKQKLLVIEDTFILNKNDYPIVKVKKYVVLNNLGCSTKAEGNYCEVKINKFKGRIDKKKVWGQKIN